VCDEPAEKPQSGRRVDHPAQQGICPKAELGVTRRYRS
jgi:hypothetical protein